MYKTKAARTTDFLNVRSKPLIPAEKPLSNVLKTLAPHEDVNMILPGEVLDDKRTWQFVEVAKGISGWVAKDFLTDQITLPDSDTDPTLPLPNPNPQIATSVISLHITSNANKALVLDLLRSAYLAGKAIRGVLLLRLGWEKEITAQEIKQVSPTTEVMLRWFYANEPGPDWNNPDLYAAGVQAAANYFKRFNNPDNEYADFHQIINEPGYGRGTVSFWQGALDVAVSLRKKLAVLCFSNGVPALPEDKDKHFYEFWQHVETHALLRRLRREGHALMLHAYILPQAQGKVWNGAYDVFRFIKIYEALPADLKDLPLRFGEYGDLQALKHGIDHFMNNVKLTDEIFKMYPFIKWAALWETGHGGDIAQWGGDQLDAAIPRLKEYILSR